MNPKTKKHMKPFSIKTKLGVLLACLLSLASCENYLELSSPDGATTEKMWVSYDAAESYLISAYTYLQPTGWRYHEYYYLPQNFRADDLFPEYGTIAWGYLASVVGFNNTAASSVPKYMWQNWYRGVKLTNDIIAHVPSMSMLSEGEKNQLLAEARFLRGFYFFHLQMNFHRIIMPLEVAQSSGDLQLAASSRAGVFAQVEKDLKFAAEHLPATADSPNRAGANAAYAFLGKAYLYEGKNQEAADALDKVTGAELLPGAKYRSLFDGTNESNSEIIFSKGYTAEKQESLELYSQLAVALAPASLKGGWEMASVSDYFMSQLEAGDLRKAATVLQSGDTFDGEQLTFENPDFNMCIKYVESLGAISSNRSVVDIILMRYADVLLLRAEANAALGNTDAANADLSEIRTRAGLPQAKFSGEALTKEIRKQRMIELIGENSRFYDLVRWGVVGEQLQIANQPYVAAFKEKHSYFPIPLEETQRNKLVEPTPGF